MKSETTLGRHLRQFLGEYLPRQRNASPRTVIAYRDALKLLLQFAAEARRCAVAELTFANIDRSTVLAFLESVEKCRGNSVATRNHRLAAIRSFFRFASATGPEVVEQCAQVLAVPLKRADSRTVDYLTVEEVNAILASVQTATREGHRDDVLLRFMYNTGARVQEVVDVRAKHLQLSSPAHVLLHGKGRKERVCPLWPDTASRLTQLLNDNQVDPIGDTPIFTNRDNKSLTRFGVRYILSKHVRAAAAKQHSLMRKNVHPHTLRHTTAMHLLQSGVDMNTIRCWLGHASVVTTNRYVEIDLEMKRRALDDLAPPKGNRRPAIKDAALLSWLESL